MAKEEFDEGTRPIDLRSYLNRLNRTFGQLSRPLTSCGHDKLGLLGPEKNYTYSKTDNSYFGSVTKQFPSINNYVSSG